jgi:hypothetical protein
MNDCPGAGLAVTRPLRLRLLNDDMKAGSMSFLSTEATPPFFRRLGKGKVSPLPKDISFCFYSSFD